MTVRRTNWNATGLALSLITAAAGLSPVNVTAGANVSLPTAFESFMQQNAHNNSSGDGVPALRVETGEKLSFLADVWLLQTQQTTSGVELAPSPLSHGLTLDNDTFFFPYNSSSVSPFDENTVVLPTRIDLTALAAARTARTGNPKFAVEPVGFLVSIGVVSWRFIGTPVAGDIGAALHTFERISTGPVLIVDAFTLLPGYVYAVTATPITISATWCLDYGPLALTTAISPASMRPLALGGLQDAGFRGHAPTSRLAFAAGASVLLYARRLPSGGVLVAPPVAQALSNVTVTTSGWTTEVSQFSPIPALPSVALASVFAGIPLPWPLVVRASEAALGAAGPLTVPLSTCWRPSTVPNATMLVLPKPWWYPLSHMASNLGASLAADSGYVDVIHLDFATAACSALITNTDPVSLSSPVAPIPNLTASFRADSTGSWPPPVVLDVSRATVNASARVMASIAVQQALRPMAAWPGVDMSRSVGLSASGSANSLVLVGAAPNGSTTLYIVVRDSDGGIGVAWAMQEVLPLVSAAVDAALAATTCQRAAAEASLLSAIIPYWAFVAGTVVGPIMAGADANATNFPDVNITLITAEIRDTLLAGASAAAAAAIAMPPGDSTGIVVSNGLLLIAGAALASLTDGSLVFPSSIVAALDTVERLLSASIPSSTRGHNSDATSILAALSAPVSVFPLDAGSSILQAMLNSLNVSTGVANSNASASYAPQVSGRRQELSSPVQTVSSSSQMAVVPDRIGTSLTLLGAGLLRGAIPGATPTSVRFTRASAPHDPTAACAPGLSMTSGRFFINGSSINGSAASENSTVMQLVAPLPRCGGGNGYAASTSGSDISPSVLSLPPSFLALATNSTPASLSAIDLHLVQVSCVCDARQISLQSAHALNVLRSTRLHSLRCSGALRRMMSVLHGMALALRTYRMPQQSTAALRLALISPTLQRVSVRTLRWHSIAAQDRALMLRT